MIVTIILGSTALVLAPLILLGIIEITRSPSGERVIRRGRRRYRTHRRRR